MCSSDLVVHCRRVSGFVFDSPGLWPLGFALLRLLSGVVCPVLLERMSYTTPAESPGPCGIVGDIFGGCRLSVCLIRVCESTSWPCGFVSSWRLKDNNIYRVSLSLLSRVS